MKIFSTLLVCGLAHLSTAGEQIRLVRYGTNVTERPSSSFAKNVIRLLETCMYQSTSDAVRPDTWPELEQSDSFALLTFTEPVALKLPLPRTMHRLVPLFEQIPINQVLVPLPVGGAGPGHLFVRSGTNVFSFCFWDALALKMVIVEPALHLASLPPYSSFALLEHSSQQSSPAKRSEPSSSETNRAPPAAGPRP